MLTTRKRQTVIFRERKMANSRQKVWSKFFTLKGRRTSLELSDGLSLQECDLPAGYLTAIYMSQDVYLAARVEIRWDLQERRYGPAWKKPGNPYICLLKFWIPNYSPIVYNWLLFSQYTHTQTQTRRHRHTNTQTHTHVCFFSLQGHHIEQTKTLGINYHFSSIKNYDTYREGIDKK